MYKSTDYTFSFDGTLKYYGINPNDIIYLYLPIPFGTVQLSSDKDNKKFIECNLTYAIRLKPVGISIQVQSLESTNSILVDNDKTYMIDNLFSGLFNTRKLNDFKNLCDIKLAYDKNLNKFYNIPDKNKCYYIIYKYIPVVQDNDYVKPIADYMEQFPKDALYIVKLPYVINHTIISSFK